MKRNNITHPGDFKKCLRAFSLIELMISLIAISLITAAFAPVISKKLSSSEFTIGAGNSSESSNTTITSTGDVEGCMLYQDNNCVICRDEYLLDSENNKCVKCENGQYLSGVECIDCPLGSICDGKEQKLCPEGKYCLGGNNIQNCPNGKWSEGGAKSESDCKSCEAGYACQNGIRSECSAGQYSKTGASVCTNCDSYNSTNSAYYSTGTKNGSCTICEAGNMRIGGSKTGCPERQFSLGGTTSCSDCTNCIECDNKTGNCTKCEEGFYILNNKCVPCTTGYYCPGGNNSTEVSCPESCISCTSSTNCTSCKQGFEYNNGKCNPCPEGSYCSGGTATSYECSSISHGCTSCTDKNTCTNCTNGYYLSSNSCIECEEGNYCADNSKTPCSAGSYNPLKKQTNSNACINCEAGTYSTGTGNTTCTQCDEGKGSAQGSSSCNLTCATGCKSCSTSGGCTGGCSEGYESQGGECIKTTEWYWFAQGGYYIAKYNVGDEGGPLGSSAALANAGISVCSVGQNCNGYGAGYAYENNKTPTCWQGQTSPLCSSYGNYSGCYRTVCNWFGANKACAHLGYSLPSSLQLTSLFITNFDTSIVFSSNGAELCDYGASSPSFTQCDDYGGNRTSLNACNGTCYGICTPRSIHGSDDSGYYENLDQTYTHISGMLLNTKGYTYNLVNCHAASVRCVKN